jgi:hypothetical protein
MQSSKTVRITSAQRMPVMLRANPLLLPTNYFCFLFPIPYGTVGL